jgi:hypothetical protein
MKNRKPAWWQLYLLVPIMGALLFSEYLAPLPGASPQIVDAGIVVLIFGAMLAWVQFNGGLIERDNMDKDKSSQDLKITVYEPSSKTNGNGNGSGDSTPFALPRFGGRVRGTNRTRFKEKDKWFLN